MIVADPAIDTTMEYTVQEALPKTISSRNSFPATFSWQTQRLHVRLLRAFPHHFIGTHVAITTCSNRVFVASSRGRVLRCTWDFTSELFEGLALSLWNQKGGENTAQHEQREDLHDVI